MNTKTKTQAPEQTAREAIKSLNDKGSSFKEELSPLQKLKQKATAKVYVTGGSTNLVGTYTVANIDDPRWGKLFDVMTKQAGKLAQGMISRLDDNDQIVIDDAAAAIIAESLVHKSANNAVVETYLGYLLGGAWPKGRGNQKMRDVIGEGVEFSFAMFKRVK